MGDWLAESPIEFVHQHTSTAPPPPPHPHLACAIFPMNFLAQMACLRSLR